MLNVIITIATIALVILTILEIHKAITIYKTIKQHRKIEAKIDRIEAKIDRIEVIILEFVKIEFEINAEVINKLYEKKK